MAPDKAKQIIDKAKEMGASKAGIANVQLLKKSPSHAIIKKLGMEIDGINPYKGISTFDEIKWPTRAKSALVIGVSHPKEKPELDWWTGLKGTIGNSELIRINKELSAWIEETYKIKTHKLPYFIEKGGIYLKDAAVLAGLGCLGKNNMLITPEFGPKIRLRALSLEEELTPTGPIEFDPCSGCEEYCKKACPQNAYGNIILSSSEAGQASLPGRDGCFSRAKCMIQMDKNCEEAGVDIFETQKPDIDIRGIKKPKHYIKYCRLCEVACPIGS
jgi:epoxyqueuosine reductase